MSNGFSNVRTSASDARVKFQLVKELAYFVSRGLEKFGFPSSGVRSAPVVSAIQATLAESMAHGVTEKLAEAALRERLLKDYLVEFDANSKMFLKEVITPTSVTRWEEEDDIIKQRYGEVVPYTKAEPSVEGALEMAWMNLRRAQQRWIVWMCLGSMLHNTPQGRERHSAEYQDFEAVSDVLRHEMRGMEKRVLMFALLKGGDAAQQAREWLLKTTLCQGMSVMEYLEYDGALPGSWQTTDEEALRQSIAAAGASQ